MGCLVQVELFAFVHQRRRGRLGDAFKVGEPGDPERARPNVLRVAAPV